MDSSLASKGEGVTQGAQSINEIERKFLCRITSPRKVLTGMKEDITQGYIKTGDPEERVRNMNGAYTHTVKAGKGISRIETETGILPEEGIRFFGETDGRTLSKHRYRIGRWEVDVYTGRHSGLVVMEIELESESESLPPFPSGIEIVGEVTEDAGYKNQRLALLSDVEAKVFVEEAYAGSMEKRGRFL